MKQPLTKEHVDAMVRKLADEGKVIESGWQAVRYLSLSPNTPTVQVNEMRKAFFLGAGHLLASLVTIVEDGKEPLPIDEERLTKIAQELDGFMNVWMTPPTTPS